MRKRGISIVLQINLMNIRVSDCFFFVNKTVIIASAYQFIVQYYVSHLRGVMLIVDFDFLFLFFLSLEINLSLATDKVYFVFQCTLYNYTFVIVSDLDPK